MALERNPRPPPWWQRLIVGVVGATAVVAVPAGVRVNAMFMGLAPAGGVAPQIELYSIASLIAFVSAWLLGIVITAFVEEEHILKCFLTSVGVPAIALAIALGVQNVE